MSTADAFTELFGRMPDLVREALGDLDVDALAHRPDPGANSIAWLLWHLTRIEDDHVAGAAAALGLGAHAEQAWLADGWAERFGLPFDPSDHGYGHGPDRVAAVRVPGELLAGYHDAVHARTLSFLAALSEEDWARVVDEGWDPPVTLLARIASVANEVAQHVGQASYLRGLLERA